MTEELKEGVPVGVGSESDAWPVCNCGGNHGCKGGYISSCNVRLVQPYRGHIDADGNRVLDLMEALKASLAKAKRVSGDIKE